AAQAAQATERIQRVADDRLRQADARVRELEGELARVESEAAETFARAQKSAEERIRAQAAELDYIHERARRAEGWLAVIEQEIKDKLIAQLAAARPPAMH